MALPLPWQKKERMQPLLIFTEGRRILDDVSLPVFKGHVDDVKRQEAWLLSSEALIQNAKNGQYYLPVSQLSMGPLLLDDPGNTECKKNKKTMKELSALIAAEAGDEADFNLQIQGKKAFMGKLIEIGILCLTLALIVVIAAGLAMAKRSGVA
jgi:hypothetical protein